MADGPAPGQPGARVGGGVAALEALQAAAASVQASVRAAEAVFAALEPMVGSLAQAHERRGGGGSGGWAGVERQGELLQQSVKSLEGLLPLDVGAAAAEEQASQSAGMAAPEGLHAASRVAAPAAPASAAAAAAQAAAGVTAPQGASALRTPPGASKRRSTLPLQPPAPKRRAPKPAKAKACKSAAGKQAGTVIDKYNWRCEDQQAYNAWAAAHPAEASIDAVWEPADVVATGTGSQGPVYLVSWKGWEHEVALHSWHTAEDLRRYNWRPALLQQRAAGKPDRGAVAGM